MNVVWHAQALAVLEHQPDDSVDLVYVDPPFGTGQKQASHGMEYQDPKLEYGAWLCKHLFEMYRVLKDTGTLYLHLDWRHVHVARLDCNGIFGTRNFLNEVIWSYNFGGRGKDRWPRKHDNILVYAKNAGLHVFNWDAIPRVPYKAPELQYVGRPKEEAEERIKRGQVPTDVWDMSIVGTSSKERTGYPTQKPLALLERIVLASSPQDGLVLDCFAGSGTAGEAAHKHGRQFLLVDDNQQAVDVMKTRFEGMEVTWK